jgi:protein-tyrosine phosphatase
VIDLHAHVLPGLDDGPPTLDAALEQARAAVDRGTRTIATTSHVDHVFNLDPDRLEAEREVLAGALAAHEIPLELRQGGEIALARLPELDDAFLRRVALGGGPWLLVEVPFSPWAEGLEALVDDLHHRGHRVLLGHPERSKALQRDPARLARLVEAGALAQVTAGSLLGDWGETARRFAISLVREGLVQVAASDTHDAVSRPPGPGATLADAAEELPELRELIPWLTEEVPAALLEGAPVPARPALTA